jgi:Na+/melibiose symporter-like transporter
MELQLTELPGGGTSVHAIIGPSFGMWKFVRAALLSCVLVAGIGILLAVLEWQNGGIAWGLYLVLLGLAGWLFLFFIVEEAKRRNKDHTELLKVFIDNALGYDCFRTDKERSMSRLIAHRTT